mgnify:CR=1 FL=1|jgi:hypothetical protein
MQGQSGSNSGCWVRSQCSVPLQLCLNPCETVGQEAAAKVRTSLLVMLPEVKIFLDVFDLDDVAKLEEYICASSSVLLMLTRGYFLSAAVRLLAA